jgi:hypothetical protein
MEHGADPFRANFRGQTPIDIAEENVCRKLYYYLEV